MRLGHGSDIGKVRKINQDSYWIGASKDDRVVLAVADGLGGHRAGEVASKMLVDAIAKYALETSWQDLDTLKKHWVEAILAANADIYQAGQADEKLAGMGTTLTMLVQSGYYLTAFHIGDSRLYLVRDKEITKLTKDHSMVQSLLDSGEITEEEAKVHPSRNMLMRAVGTDPNVEVDAFDITWEEGDTYLLCSDGLTNFVEESDIKEILIQEMDEESAVRQLIHAANANGGGDNITAIIFKPEVNG